MTMVKTIAQHPETFSAVSIYSKRLRGLANTVSWAGGLGTAQTVKRLCYRHEVLGLDPQCPY